MARKQKSIPLNRLSDRCVSGIFIKSTSDWAGHGTISFPHRDDYYMLLVLFDGEAQVTVDFKNITIVAGQGLVVAPGQVHFPMPGKKTPKAWCLFVTPDNIGETAQLSLERQALNVEPVNFDGETLAEMSHLFEMLRRHDDDTEFSRAMATAIINLFCLAAYPSRHDSSSRYTAITLRLRHLLDNNLSAEKRPSAYASMLNISGVYLNEAVKAVTGMSVGGYIRAQVVLAAKRQLAHSSLTVREVAASLGYDDYSYFSRLFRKETGVTPTVF